MTNFAIVTGTVTALNEVSISANNERQLMVADPHGREMMISCGAALFNMRVALRYLGLVPKVRVLPDHVLGDHPALDVLLVPGGMGTRREVSNPEVTGWIRAVSATAVWTTSVCTGALLLHEAGPARGRRVATHVAFEDTLQERGDISVIRDARYVVDGNVVTSQGVSAGIDMALWLIGALHGRDHSRRGTRHAHRASPRAWRRLDRARARGISWRYPRTGLRHQ